MTIQCDIYVRPFNVSKKLFRIYAVGMVEFSVSTFVMQWGGNLACLDFQFLPISHSHACILDNLSIFFRKLLQLVKKNEMTLKDAMQEWPASAIKMSTLKRSASTKHEDWSKGSTTPKVKRAQSLVRLS